MSITTFSSLPFSLISKGSNEDGEGIDLRVRGQDLGKAFRPDAVAFQVGIAEHHHKMLVSLLSCQFLNAGVSALQSVVTAHAELSVGMHGLRVGMQEKLGELVVADTGKSKTANSAEY